MSKTNEVERLKKEAAHWKAKWRLAGLEAEKNFLARLRDVEIEIEAEMKQFRSDIKRILRAAR